MEKLSSKLSWALEGGDLIAASLLRKIEGTGTYFDIGAADPIEISNTYAFYNKGWKGVAVDGREDLAEKWEKYRPNDKFVCALVGERDGEEKEYYQFPDSTMNTVDIATADRYSLRFEDQNTIISSRKLINPITLWRGCYQDTVPDLVSLDIEGFELQVLEGLRLEVFRPALIIIETKLFNFANVSSQPIVNFMEKKGYKVIAKTPLDAFFIDPLNEIFDWIPREMLYE